MANRTAMDPLQVLDNDTFSPIHILPIPSFSPRGQSPLGQSPGGGANPKKNPGSKHIGIAPHSETQLHMDKTTVTGSFR